MRVPLLELADLIVKETGLPCLSFDLCVGRASLPGLRMIWMVVKEKDI